MTEAEIFRSYWEVNCDPRIVGNTPNNKPALKCAGEKYFCIWDTFQSRTNYIFKKVGSNKSFSSYPFNTTSQFPQQPLKAWKAVLSMNKVLEGIVSCESKIQVLNQLRFCYL